MIHIEEKSPNKKATQNNPLKSYHNQCTGKFAHSGGHLVSANMATVWRLVTMTTVRRLVRLYTGEESLVENIICDHNMYLKRLYCNIQIKQFSYLINRKINNCKGASTVNNNRMSNVNIYIDVLWHYYTGRYYVNLKCK